MNLPSFQLTPVQTFESLVKRNFKEVRARKRWQSISIGVLSVAFFATIWMFYVVDERNDALQRELMTLSMEISKVNVILEGTSDVLDLLVERGQGNFDSIQGNFGRIQDLDHRIDGMRAPL